MWTLTEVIGRRGGADRTKEFATIEMSKTAYWAGFVGAGIGLLIAALFVGVMGAYSVLWVILMPFVAAFFATYRARTGMKLRPHESFLVKTRSHPGEILWCSRVVDPFSAHLFTMIDARHATRCPALESTRWVQ